MIPQKQEVISEFVFKQITRSEYAIVLEHLRANFYSDEPVNKLIGTSQDRVTDQHRRYTDMLNRYPKSLCAMSVIDEPGSVAGVLIVNIHEKNNRLPAFNPRSELTREFLHFLNQIESKCNIFEKYNVSTFPELAILSTDKRHRGKGLATELYRRAIEQLFRDGFPLIYSEFSNPISRKIGEKLGFTEVGRFYFHQYREKHGFRPYAADNDGYVSMMVLEKNTFEMQNNNNQSYN